MQARNANQSAQSIGICSAATVTSCRPLPEDPYQSQNPRANSRSLLCAVKLAGRPRSLHLSILAFVPAKASLTTGAKNKHLVNVQVSPGQSTTPSAWGSSHLIVQLSRLAAGSQRCPWQLTRPPRPLGQLRPGSRDLLAVLERDLRNLRTLMVLAQKLRP